MKGNVHAAQFVSKLVERRVILGLHTPQLHTLQIIDARDPVKNNTDRLETALAVLIEDKRETNNVVDVRPSSQQATKAH